MPDYFVFGGCLRSELVFNELSTSVGRMPDWTLRISRLPHENHAEVLSDTFLSRNCHIRITRGENAFRYHHSCTGTFEVSANGRDISFEPAANGDLNAARTDFVSRVLLYCVNRGEVAWLHGSAVRIAESGVAFLGPSGAGKSTIALALARAGAVHICDDTLPVEAGPEPMVWPSDHVIRLRPDSREQLASEANAIRRESDGKFVLTHGAVGRDVDNRVSTPGNTMRVPLRALYLLNPIESGERPRISGAHAERGPLSPRAALPALMQHIKLGPLIRPGDPALYMRQLGAIVSSVPVFELRLTRDWSRIDEVVTQLLAWHADSMPTAVDRVPPMRVPA
jgi:hypothetical protein